MRFLAAVVLALAVAGCGGEASSAERVEKCVDRLVRNGPPDAGTSEAELRRYVRSAYCERFEDSGFVYDDGALEIGAQEWLDRSGSAECAAARPGEPARTVPCDELRGPRTIDCALLHHVRRREVREYLERRGEVECDDGTPVEELGAP